MSISSALNILHRSVDSVTKTSSYVSNKIYQIGIYLLRNPILLFCTTRWLSSIVAEKITDSYLEKNQLQKVILKKTCIKALEFFFNFALAWAVLAAVGTPLTLSHTITFIYTSLAYSAAIDLFFNLCDFSPAIDEITSY